MLKFNPFTDSSVYRFVDPDTGYTYQASSKQDLIKQIITYRHNNQLADIEALGLTVENYLCSLPENAGRCHEVPEWNLKFSDYLQGGIRLFKSWLFKNFVSQEEAENRATQCMHCPENIWPENRQGYHDWAEKAALYMRGKRSTPYDGSLGMCGACGCVNRAGVFYKGDYPDYTPEQIERLRKVNCWKLKVIDGKDQGQ